jgi:lysozyme
MNDAGIELIKSFEGLRLKAYRCSAGVLTIGYGHTSGVTEGQEIDEAEAERLLREDIAEFEAGVLRVATDPTPNQFSAMVSLAFNIGLAAFGRSTVLRKHNAGDHADAAEAFMLWNKAGGRVLQGLIRRRAAERALYLS